jgi:RNA 3'-terminal phosphate cyclase
VLAEVLDHLRHTAIRELGYAYYRMHIIICISRYETRVESDLSTWAQGRHVLLAEDNLINQTVAKKMLSHMGITCTVAANGAEALAAVTAPGSSFDVVLMDMAMPVMGGVSATKVCPLSLSLSLSLPPSVLSSLPPSLPPSVPPSRVHNSRCCMSGTWL